MDIILGGLLENAMIRSHDETHNPERNSTPHPYYISLNRSVPTAIKTRCDTFLSIASEVSIPTVDWNVPYEQKPPFDFIKCPDSSRERDTEVLATVLLENGAVTPDKLKEISNVEVSQAQDDRTRATIRHDAARMYVDRLLSQVHLAQELNKLMILTDLEVSVLSQITSFVLQHRIPTPFDLPDMTTTGFINGEAVGIVSNFEARDIQQLIAVRQDKTIKSYAAGVAKALKHSNVAETERDLILALRQARKNSVVVERYQKGFEVFSWITKPLSYVPFISDGVTATNDVIALFRSWMKRKSSHVSWHLLGARLQEVAIEEYLSRKHNLR